MLDSAPAAVCLVLMVALAWAAVLLPRREERDRDARESSHGEQIDGKNL